jgi:hypothetical protein
VRDRALFTDSEVERLNDSVEGDLGPFTAFSHSLRRRSTEQEQHQSIGWHQDAAKR